MEESNHKEETREALYRRELATILRSSALINSSLNIEQVLDNAMKWAEEFMGAEDSTVYELEDRSNELVVRLARGEKKRPLERITLKVGYWGTGIFPAGASHVLDFAFTAVGVARLEARAVVMNGRGNGALRKVGAVQEGLFRRSFLRHGQYHDQVLWSMLADEWHRKRNLHRTRIH